MEKLKIFISSTMEDLQDERMALARAIETNPFWEAVYAEAFVARTESPRQVCLEEVGDSHVYVGIFKDRYGYIPEENNPRSLSVVALEYEEALDNQLHTFIFVNKDDANRETRLRKFLQEITNFDRGHWRKEYTDVNELIRLALDAINRQTTRDSVEAIQNKRKLMVSNIYRLPYFKRVKEKLEI